MPSHHYHSPSEDNGWIRKKRHFEGFLVTTASPFLLIPFPFSNLLKNNMFHYYIGLHFSLTHLSLTSNANTAKVFQEARYTLQQQ